VHPIACDFPIFNRIEFMAKALIIAEKPSVALDISRVLGGFTKQGDYLESDDYVLSSAIGHLVEIAAPEQYEVKRGKWSFANLPVLPPHFDLRPIARGEDRLKLLTKLIKRKDVDRLINACDAGREGELIFRLIAQHAKAKQPVQRLWLQSMTPTAIREAFTNLRSDISMKPLADAARCRSEADWMVGINGTRAMTAFNSRDGGFYLTTVGRVQTPTLTIVVEREEKIRKFVSKPYFEVKAAFGVQAGSYDARWFDPKFKKNDDPDARAERIWEEAKAKQIVADCQGKQGIIADESKPSTQLAPALFDLTSLQREGNARFGFSAKTTLSIAQALYEKHKVLTYPRTDSKALPEDYIDTVKQTFSVLEESSAYALFARKILANSWVKPNKRIFDNSKISDHFAIIPTLQTPKPGALSDAEQKIYDTVVKRFLAIFFPAAEYLVTTRITTVASHQFKTEGKVLKEAGWLAVYGKSGAIATNKPDTESDKDLPQVNGAEKASTDEVAAVALHTKPPARYSEATLLSAMEGAGKLVDDDELREAMGTKGLGTPATRAAIIEGLIDEKYILRDGRELQATAKAFQLLTLLRGLDATELTMPELTGEWEFKLSQIERGKLERDVFMSEIAQMTQQLVARAKNYESDTVPGDYATLSSKCPKCSNVVKENYKRFACTSCDFSITKVPGSRQFELPEVETLLTEKIIGPLQGFRSRIGRPFAAILKITDEHKLEFDFGQNDDSAEGGEPIDFSAQTSLGHCPKCTSNVFEHGMSYVCEKAVGTDKTCDFKSGKVILQQPIEPEQMQKLLGDAGRTDLLTKFVSSRTKRSFKAFLSRGKDGKVGFEFEPRAVKAPSAKKAAIQATETIDADGVIEKVSIKKSIATKKAAKKPASKKPAAKKAAAKKPTVKKSTKK
jgi:DNA topoisomerase III